MTTRGAQVIDADPEDRQKLLLSTASSFQVGVRVKSDRNNWVYNGLRFQTTDEAAMYAKALVMRWGDAVDYTVEPSTDLPNCTYPVPSDRYPVQRQLEENGADTEPC